MTNFENIHRRHKSDNRYVVGFIFIIVGALLLGRNFHIIPHWVSNFFVSWQMLLIVIGVVFVFVKKNLTSGLILIAIGSIFLLKKFWFFTVFQWNMVWPVAFVFVGVLLISNVIGHRVKHNRYDKHRSFELDEFDNEDDFENNEYEVKKQ
ncbi:MAG: hypothetical protein B6I20_06775 [Bacteroidetes bacterium 4572_117]|nr:MAG: hypothetical protein B6I20_06775 [Bacteroidetes bacterium 4572_117]